jgi:hypothetical protein
MTLKELAREIEIIKNNHLKHIEEDIDKIERKVNGLDARLWWVLAILVGATVVPLMAKFLD